MANNITDYLIQLQKLTQTNLKILQTLNDSLYSDREHLTVRIDDKTSYVIPSFIALENKINSLQSDFENLVNAPKTGEADFHFDGNSQTIQLKGFSNTPLRLTLDTVKNFDVNRNDILKDFLTPEPFVRFQVDKMSNDINHVNVRKVIPKTEKLIKLFSELTNGSSSVQYEYSELKKNLATYKEDVDYVMYDTLKHMPIKKNMGYGEYEIEKIIDYRVEHNFIPYYTLKLNKALTYKIFDETIERNLSIGDELITYNDKVKMKIIDLNTNTRTLTVQILNGGYANLVDNSNTNVDLYTLKYFNSKNIDKDKYVDVPLEEDRYVFIFIAPVNDQMMIQAPWGTGVFVDVYNLNYSDGSHTYYFKDYYDMFVNNIGDSLYSLTAMIKNNIFNHDYQDYIKLTTAKPVINTDDIVVTEINAHLNDASAVKNIRSLYTQKQTYKLELDNVQKDIDAVNAQLSALSFQDTTNTRTIYTAQLTQLNERKQDLVNSISSILQEISTNANNSDIPIENAKYHIRGYFDWTKFLKVNELNNINVIKILVQYRYKNKDKVTGNALSIGKNENGDSDFIYSDWNVMDSPYLKMMPIHDQITYRFNYPANNNNINEPSFNQIDIPISQGESVDIRLKVVYDLGYPYVESTSDWSDIVNVEFPLEFLKKVSILDIIEENNNDIKKDQFKGLLQSGGYTKHVDDRVIDQDITYFHHPEYISSGFYTAERRVIPLKDKLNEFNDNILQLQDEVFGTSSEDLELSIVDGNINTILTPYSNNVHIVTAYNDSTKSNGEVVANLKLQLKNKGDHNVKLFSLFPGNMELDLTSKSKGFYPASNYVNDKLCVYIQNTTDKNANKQPIEVQKQMYNQFLYFRINDAYTMEPYYFVEDVRSKPDQLYGGIPNYNKDLVLNTKTTVPNAVLFPSIKTKSDLSIGSPGDKYRLIKPGEIINIDLVFKYRLAEDEIDNDVDTDTIQKTMALDIRTSLYNEPINYLFTIKANFNDSIDEKVKRVATVSNKYNPVVV